MSINPKILDDLVYYLHERERVRLKKEAGEPRPWTEDKALSLFRFTNVLRANDYTTRWLVNHWYEPNKNASLEEILLNCGIARYFGTAEFCEVIGWTNIDDWEASRERIRKTAADRMWNGKRVFTSAYVITNGGISDKKYNVVLDHYLQPFYEHIDDLVSTAEKTQSWEQVGAKLMRLQGFGGTGFMAKEVLSDFILATEGRIAWKDLMDWSPVGPGAVRGLNWLYDRPSDKKAPKSQSLAELKEVAAALAPRLEPWMPQYGKELDLHAIQFAMCELAKWCKVSYDGERMKNNYKPRA